MYIKQNYEMEDIYKHLWDGAKERWLDATDEQRQHVWDRISYYWDELNPPTMTEINDFIWFDCDDIFFPDDNE